MLVKTLERCCVEAKVREVFEFFKGPFETEGF